MYARNSLTLKEGTTYWYVVAMYNFPFFFNGIHSDGKLISDIFQLTKVKDMSAIS